MSSVKNLHTWQGKNNINFLLFIVFSIFSTAFYLNSVFYKYATLENLLLSSIWSTLFFALNINFFLTFSPINEDYYNRKFQSYGYFFSPNYWKGYEKISLIMFCLVFLILLFFSIILGIAFDSRKTGKNYNDNVLLNAFFLSVLSHTLLYILSREKILKYIKS